MATTDIGPERRGLGRVAIGWICFMILAHAWAAYRLGDEIYDLVSHSDPRWRNDLYWALPVLLGLAVFNILSLCLLLARLKIGVFLFGAATVAALVVNVYIEVPLTAILLSLVGLFILGMLVRSRWDVLR